MDTAGLVLWEASDRLMHSRLAHVGDAEVGVVSELTGVDEPA